MAISDKLQELLVIKQDIKEAIENKGVDMTDVEFRGYAEKINQIETGGGANLDRIGIISPWFYLRKTSSASQTLTYEISSEMLSKTFFTDGKGNWYLPEDVSVYYGSDYKGKANTNLTLYSGTTTFPSGVSFKVGTTPVGLLLYYYEYESTGSGLDSNGYINIKWSGNGEVFPHPYYTEFIELPDDFFDDFYEYSDPEVDYWKKENFFPIPISSRTSLQIGWYLWDAD